jgi:hypothetical protein
MLGRSAIAPSFSKMPSVTIKRRAALLALLLDGDECVLEAPGVVVVVTADGRARDLEALLDCKADATVGDNQVVALVKREDDRGDRREDCEQRIAHSVPSKSARLHSSSRCMSGRVRTRPKRPCVMAATGRRQQQQEK